MEQDLTCGVCSELYSEGQREPVLLPNCGHCFCRPCLLSLEKNGCLECPFCRRLNDSVPVLQLPVVFALLGLSKYFRRSKHGPCGVHGSVLEFWCRRCQSGLCGRCLFEGHDQRYVVQMEVIIEEKKSLAQRRGLQKLGRINAKKAEAMGRVTEGLFRLAAVCLEAEALSAAERVTKQAMDGAQNALDVDSVLQCLQRLEQRHEGRDDSPSASGSPCKASVLQGKEEQEKLEKVEHGSTTARRGIRRLHRNSRSISLDDRRGLNNIIICDRHRMLSDGQDQRTEADKCNRSLNRTSSTPANEEVIPPDPDSAPEEGGGTTSSSPPVAVSETAADTPTRSLRCFALSDDGRQARLRWEGGRLHMYALSSRCDDPQLTLQLSVVECILQESPEVFLDLCAEGRRLGRIYIRLWGHLRRARHFLALCLGSLGPSFRGSKFSKVESKDKAGECLRVSHYMSAEGAMSAMGLMEGLEWGGDHCLPKRAGLVVAASGGKPEYDGCFDICTRDHPAKKFSCPFGEVAGGAEGMEVVREAARHEPVTEVSISEVGVVLTDQQRCEHV
ncbi:uncharacterized protein LOC134765632 [Penaeus indicus]|uniref:uncharacterized protein LOC134765632 n=1 Tax=Penaeus indicus TaxID=29960 RepID=UPI00300CBA4B